MSSMRNAVQRRNHRERAQPFERQKWGLLEKHKDYSLRAADHKAKQKRLKALKEKAAFANPDEFSFGMMSSRTKGGMKIGKREGGEAMSVQTVAALKGQDAGYVRTMLQRTRRERERLEMEIQVGESGEVRALREGGNGGGGSGERDGSEDEDWEDEVVEVQPKRTLFVDTVEQLEQFNGDEDADSDHAVEEGSGEEPVSAKKLSRREAEMVRWKQIEEGRAKKKRAHQQQVRRALLEAVREREQELVKADQELEMQRARMANTIGGVNKQGVKFKIKERKR